MGAKSNAKGSGFEIEVCRILTEWVTSKRRPEIFWRSATSGAKATVDHKAGRQSHMGGDIVSIHPDGQWVTDMFSIECKNRKSFGTLPHFLMNTAPLLDWWGQCCKDAQDHKKTPWLIFKEKNSKIYTAIPATGQAFIRSPLYKTIEVQAPPRISFFVAELGQVLRANSKLVRVKGRLKPQWVTQ